MIEIQVPDLGENVEEAEVLKVLVQEGDRVAVDQAILEFETEKATFEMPSSEAGTVARIHVKEGDSVRIGQTVMELDASRSGNGAKAPEGAAADDTQDAEPEKPAARKPAARKGRQAQSQEVPARTATARTEDKAEDKDEDEAEGGEATSASEKRPAREADADADSDSDDDAAGKTAPPQEDRPPSGADRSATPTQDEEDQETGGSGSETEERTAHDWAAGPATRRLARELGVDLSELAAATGSGRITREDLKAHVRQRPAMAGAHVKLPDFSKWGRVERRPMSRLERTAAAHLAQAWNAIPHVTQHDEADITALEEARRRYDAGREDADPKITWTVLAVKAVVAALRDMPRFNSSYDPAAQELVYKRYFHIGIAVDTERGLVVPVVRDAERKTTREIAVEISDLAKRARDRKLMLEDMEGGTFTISNLGGLGGTAFTPIVNLPEVAILGMSRARRAPDLEGGTPRLMLPLSLSYDHRVIDGASAVRFLRRIIRMLEDPLHLLLES